MSQNYRFFDRDLSWLSFNGRVLEEAGREATPLLERIRFLSIYSSNLDEFYRVRMPVVMALQKIGKTGIETASGKHYSAVLEAAREMISRQLQQFGTILTGIILPALEAQQVSLVYNGQVPPEIKTAARQYFLTQVLAFLQPVYLADLKRSFFPENNKLYLLVLLEVAGADTWALLNIPSDALPRFFTTQAAGRQYVVFLDDIVKDNLSFIFSKAKVKGCYSFKVTRDAELELKDDYAGDVAERIEQLLSKRDQGLATRFLHEPGIPLAGMDLLVHRFHLEQASLVTGGRYHNLRDLADFPVQKPGWSYPPWPAVRLNLSQEERLLDQVAQQDRIIHTPYHAYDSVLRFFNEAAIDPDVTEIYVTMYRIASDSRIAHALASAARNGKKITVLVELKARFDEANNIKWAKQLKAAGVKIIYSATSLKVHAKIALVKKQQGYRLQYTGLLATGNLNENTARFYTDHVLLTARPQLVRELELLFIYLEQRKKGDTTVGNPFDCLLVARFNLQQRFLEMIDREIEHARQGLPAGIVIKLNNLEEEVLIRRLYDASCAGVEVHLIVRSICRLVPGVPGMSERITVTRIVDRYLEHGRIFLFHNKGKEDMYLGSADWMNRNIYRRIEVCFPVLDAHIRSEIKHLLQVQLQDNVQAVTINEALDNEPVEPGIVAVRSQEAIYQMVAAGRVAVMN